nr:MAG TPA: hypothetical protein [Caudoviricetes sp.]
MLITLLWLATHQYICYNLITKFYLLAGLFI